MIHRYLKQLTQISIINFFFILGLLFFIQKNKASFTTHKSPINQKATIPLVTSPRESIPPVIDSPTSASSVIVPPRNLFSELPNHNTKADCWLAVGGNMYDVSGYFGSHPGGDGPLQKYCGHDATAAFQSKDGIGANHSASAYDLLGQYLIQ